MCKWFVYEAPYYGMGVTQEADMYCDNLPTHWETTAIDDTNTVREKLLFADGCADYEEIEHG